MKKLAAILILACAFQLHAQTNDALLKHFESYYEQMKTQGDVQGVINALTHLNLLAPNQGRTDTIAVLYMNEGRHIQALNTIGIEKNADDSDMAVEVKAVSLQALRQNDRAIEQYEELFKRKPSAPIAYELADLKLQKNDLTGATLHITYGIANSRDEMMRPFYESQTPYQVPMKAAFIYLKGLVAFQENQQDNIDEAVAFFEQALALAPNFNLAQLSKDALLARKAEGTKE